MSSGYHIAVIGIGAMGSLFAGRLSGIRQTGDDGDQTSNIKVTMIGSWREQIDAIRNNGLQVIHPDGRTSTHRPNIAEKEDVIDPADFALVLVKSHQTAAAADTVKNFLKNDGLAITLQNGLGNDYILSVILGEDQVTQGVIMQGASMHAPGIVRQAGNGKIYLGEKGPLRSKLVLLSDIFEAAGLSTTITARTDEIIWRKLSINAAVNPVTALLEIKNGEILTDPFAMSVAVAASREIAELAVARGILFSGNVKDHLIHTCRTSAENRSSMLQDIRRGVRTEIDAINGAALKLALKMEFPMPVNQMLYAMVKQKEVLGTVQLKPLQALMKQLNRN